MKTHITQNHDDVFPYVGVVLSDNAQTIITLGIFTTWDHAEVWCEHVADACEREYVNPDAPDEAAPILNRITHEFPDDWVLRTLH